MQLSEIVPANGATRLRLVTALNAELKNYDGHLFAPLLSAQDETGYWLVDREPLLLQMATIGSLEPLFKMWEATQIWWQEVCRQHNKIPEYTWSSVAAGCVAGNLSPSDTYDLIWQQFNSNRNAGSILQGHSQIQITSNDGSLHQVQAQQFYQRDIFNITARCAQFPGDVGRVFAEVAEIYLARDVTNTGKLITPEGKLRDHYAEIAIYLADLKKQDPAIFESVLFWLGNSRSPYFQSTQFIMICDGSDLAANAFPTQLPTTLNYCAGLVDSVLTES